MEILIALTYLSLEQNLILDCLPYDFRNQNFAISLISLFNSRLKAYHVG